ncbi:MAG TPA: hypothetical protein VNB22_04435 [Pyrinomonadaceae bacterium]|jgi:hypothetical protein|nr:hypothetical protein [Pyrinomonadaceae bacterium]
MLNSNELGKLSDRELLAQARAYESILNADAASLNFGTAESIAMKSVNNAFAAALDAWDAVQIEEAGISQSKADGRKALLAELRRQRNVLYADAGVSDSALANAGLPPRDKVKTASPAPTTAPMGWVDYGKLKHVIHFRDSATPDKKAKPAGMQGCEIWRFVGTSAPVSENDYDYVATDSDSPYVAFYAMADAGKKVYYLLRWLSKSGARGEWSETIEATVNG